MEIVSKHSIFVFCLMSVSCGLGAQQAVWQPSPGHRQVPIWPGAVPDALPLTGPEISTTREQDHLVAGKPWTYVERVSQPTMTVYSPATKNTGTAVVVFPGGGYWILAIDLEGTEGMRLADVEGDHVCAVEVSGPGRTLVSEGRALSGVADSVGRCAENTRSGEIARCGLAY